MADLDAPLRCIVCGHLLDEDPRERSPDLVKPPNVHEVCMERFAAEMRAEDPYPDLGEDAPSES